MNIMPAGKDNEFSLSPEIARLSALLARDPNSKLFMPLAEEYIKAGMAEEAVMTLEDGLKANPYYMSARVLLGKAYLEKGDLDSARAQFEQVVKTVPDNLFAHRKLGDIYKILGDRENAIRSYRMITLLSPKDEEAKRLLAELESGAPMTPPPAPETAAVEKEAEPVATPSPVQEAAEPEPEPEKSPVQSSAPAFVLEEEPEIIEAAEPSEAVPDEPKPVVSEAPLEEEETAVPEAAEAEAAAVEEEAPAVYAMEEDVPVSDEGLDLPQQPGEATEITPRKSGYALDLSQAAGLEDIFEACESATSEDVSQSPEGVYEINDLSGAGISLVPAPEASPAAPAMPDRPIEEAAVLDAEFAPVSEAKEDKEPFETETLAELYIAQGFYDRAITIYKNMLLLEPQNRSLKQKLEELYQLEKLRAAMAKPVEPEAPPAEPEPLPVDVGVQDEGEGIVWEAEAEMVPEAAITCDPAAVNRLERLLENIRRKGRR